LLPFAAGAAVFAGLAMGAALDRYSELKRSARTLVKVCLALSVVLLLVTLPANISNARLQLIVDDTNSRMVAYLASTVPAGGGVQVNLLGTSEYILEIKLHLAHLYNRPDISVSAFSLGQPRKEPAEVGIDSLLVSPGIENQPLLSVRLGVYELTNDELNRQMKASLGTQVKPAAIFESSFRQFNLDFLRLACPFFNQRTFCRISNPILDVRPLHYWWEIYAMRSGEK
jgi:hypothetical protein